MRLNVLYFASVREKIGTGQEQVETNAHTAAELVQELIKRGEGYALAFEDLSHLRIAINQELGDLQSPLDGAAEVAFFPPMTGG